MTGTGVLRVTTDAGLRAERDATDRELAGHRIVAGDALQSLLAGARGNTDRSLHAERAGSDDALATRDEFLRLTTSAHRPLS